MDRDGGREKTERGKSLIKRGSKRKKLKNITFSRTTSIHMYINYKSVPSLSKRDYILTTDT